MKALKSELDALRSVLMTPLGEFITDKEQAEHKDPEGLAQKRMFTKAIEAVDEARGSRTMWIVVLRHGTVSVTYTSYGPWATRAQASKAAEGILATVHATAVAVVPLRSPEGWAQMVAAADEPSAEKSQWLEVRRDAEARRKGFRGKARERDAFLSA